MGRRVVHRRACQKRDILARCDEVILRHQEARVEICLAEGHYMMNVWLKTQSHRSLRSLSMVAAPNSGLSASRWEARKN